MSGAFDIPALLREGAVAKLKGDRVRELESRVEVLERRLKERDGRIEEFEQKEYNERPALFGPHGWIADL